EGKAARRRFAPPAPAARGLARLYLRRGGYPAGPVPQQLRRISSAGHGAASAAPRTRSPRPTSGWCRVRSVPYCSGTLTTTLIQGLEHLTKGKQVSWTGSSVTEA